MIPDLAGIVGLYVIVQLIALATRSGPRAENPVVVVCAVLGILATFALLADIHAKSVSIDARNQQSVPYNQWTPYGHPDLNR